MHDLTCTTVRELTLDTLEPAPENVRTAPPEAAALAELKASLAAHGLLASLVVRPIESVRPRYAVVAGGRRLAALKALAAEGAIPVNHPVPCRVDGSDTPPGELSLAENVVRVAMHPADQAQAFGRLAAGGASAAAIAARFGVSERVVAQRLRLGNAAPALLDAYRAGDLDLDTVQAFAMTADPARQMAVYEELRTGHVRPSPWQVRRRLAEGRVPGSSALARFVGVEAYEAAGGALDRDLFADDEGEGLWFEDPKLLSDLAMSRLRVAADELATHWKWAEPVLDADWSATARFGRVHPAPATPTEAERAELDRLEARLDALAQQDTDCAGEAQEERRLAERIDAIEAAVEARALYSPEVRALAGCIVSIGEDGAMAVIRGLVRPEDVPAKPAAPANGAGDAPAGEAAQADAARPDPRISAPARTPPPADPEAEARKAAGVGIGLADDLRAIRTAHVKAQLACRFEAAFDLLLFHLARSVFGTGYGDSALDVTARPTPDVPAVRANDPAFAKVNIGVAHLEVDRIGQPLEWLDQPTGEAFAELRAMSPLGKEYLFASCVARTLKGQLAFEPGARPETEATVARLDIDFARLYRPDAALLFGRLRKDRLLDIARATLGEAWAAAHRNDRKAALAEAMEAAFAAGAAVPAGVSPSGRAAALAWVPPGFRAFDSGRAEEDEAPACGTDAASGEAPPPANGGDAPGPHVIPNGPEAEEDPGETAHEDGAGAASQTACPGNGHDPGALPAFLRRSA